MATAGARGGGGANASSTTAAPPPTTTTTTTNTTSQLWDAEGEKGCIIWVGMLKFVSWVGGIGWADGNGTSTGWNNGRV